MNDEELQEMLDKGMSVSGNPEYRELYKILENTDNTILPAGFAHRVTARLENSRSADPVKKWILGLIVLVVLAFALVMVILVGTRPELRIPGSGQLNLYAMFALSLIPVSLYHFIERKRHRDPFTGN